MVIRSLDGHPYICMVKKKCSYTIRFQYIFLHQRTVKEVCRCVCVCSSKPSKNIPLHNLWARGTHDLQACHTSCQKYFVDFHSMQYWISSLISPHNTNHNTIVGQGHMHSRCATKLSSKCGWITNVCYSTGGFNPHHTCDLCHLYGVTSAWQSFCTCFWFDPTMSLDSHQTKYAIESTQGHIVKFMNTPRHLFKGCDQTWTKGCVCALLPGRCCCSTPLQSLLRA